MERRSASSIRLTSAPIRSLRPSTSSRLLPMAKRSMRRAACACLRTSVICSSITPPSAWWRRRRFTSATCWKVRIWNGGRSSTSVRCNIQTSRPATTGFAWLRATTVGCGTKWAMCSTSRSPRRTTRPAGFARSARSLCGAVLWAGYHVARSPGRASVRAAARRTSSTSARALRESCTTHCFRASTVCCCDSRPRRTCCRIVR